MSSRSPTFFFFLSLSRFHLSYMPSLYPDKTSGLVFLSPPEPLTPRLPYMSQHVPLRASASRHIIHPSRARKAKEKAPIVSPIPSFYNRPYPTIPQQTHHLLGPLELPIQSSRVDESRHYLSYPPTPAPTSSNYIASRLRQPPSLSLSLSTLSRSDPRRQLGFAIPITGLVV